MTRRQILTIPSLDPQSDFKFVLKLFPGVFDNNDEIHLLENKFTVMMFVPTELDRNVVTWSTDTTFPVESSSPTDLNRITLGSLELCEIILPSRTTLIQCPLEMPSADCRKLAMYLRNRYNDDASQVTQKDGEPFVLPAFPTLDVQLLGANGSYHPFPLNSPTPIPVETELFRGKILVLLRPPNPETDDPFWNERIFSGRQRRIVIQIQGRFLRKPRGVVYAGAQISDPMKLGLITRGVTTVLLRLVESFKKDVHYSYGSAEESAHIVAPAYSFFERVVVTEPGETPPHMEETFPESNESITLRKSAAKTFEWNTTDTYSFSFFSMYIDLLRWKLVNIPATGDLSLQTFWGHSMLNICMYERDRDASGSQHLDRNNKYAFSVRARHLGDRASDESRRGGGSDTESIALLPWSERNVGTSTGSLPDTAFVESPIGRSESQVFTSVDLSSLSPIRYSDEPVIISEDQELNFFDAEQGRDDNTMSQQESMSPSELLKLIDATCPFWIDVYRGQGTTTLFAVNKDNTTSFRKSISCEELVRGVMNSSLSRHVKQFSPRLSQLERLRRSLGICLSFQETSFSRTDPINVFHEDSENKLTCLAKGSTVREDGVLLAGMVGRALSDRHWVVEWAIMSDDKKSLLFYRNSEKRRHHFQVKLSTISAIELMGEDLAPKTFGCHLLALTTIGRTLYIMLGSKEDCRVWCDGLKELVQKATMTPLDGVESNVLRLFEIENIASEFLHNSSMWRCKNRRLLNCGKFHFREGNALSLESKNPLAVVSEALRSTLAAQAEGLEDAERRRGFLDSVSKLKAVSIAEIGEEDKLVFFLNLYHVMVSHAFLILGPPDSSLKWFKYFNVIAYQVNDDIFSLSELEHCIIRSNMTYPAQLFSKFVIPKTKFKIALSSTNDFRINFALNCGSLSIPPTIPVYDVCRIEEQLDEASRLYLNTATSRLTTSGTLVLNLPRVVQWFADDFGDDQASRLESVRRLLPEEIQTNAEAASRVEVKFQPFSFECRPVSLQTEPSASKNISSSTT